MQGRKKVVYAALLGNGRAARKADERHPFGYGMELYFWSFVVAILIFALGAGVSIYEGVQKILHPHPVTDPYVNYIVLGVAIAFEAGAWSVAYKEFKKSKGRLGFLAAVRQSKDPAVFAVLFEDSAAMLGLIAAFLGIGLGQVFDLPVLDAVASVVIGVILAVTAALLAYECKGLLIGESASPAVVAKVRRLATEAPQIRRINEILTMHLGPEDVLLNLSLDVDDAMTAGEVEAAISQNWAAHLKSAVEAERPEGS
jgi:cation diffusion facilitator family transporter